MNARFRILQDMVAKYSIADTDIYNFEETGFMMAVISTGMVITNAEKPFNNEISPT